MKIKPKSLDSDSAQVAAGPVSRAPEAGAQHKGRAGMVNNLRAEGWSDGEIAKSLGLTDAVEIASYGLVLEQPAKEAPKPALEPEKPEPAEIMSAPPATEPLPEVRPIEAPVMAEMAVEPALLAQPAPVVSRSKDPLQSLAALLKTMPGSPLSKALTLRLDPLTRQQFERHVTSEFLSHADLVRMALDEASRIPPNELADAQAILQVRRKEALGMIGARVSVNLDGQAVQLGLLLARKAGLKGLQPAVEAAVVRYLGVRAAD